MRYTRSYLLGLAAMLTLLPHEYEAALELEAERWTRVNVDDLGVPLWLVQQVEHQGSRRVGPPQRRASFWRRLLDTLRR